MATHSESDTDLGLGGGGGRDWKVQVIFRGTTLLAKAKQLHWICRLYVPHIKYVDLTHNQSVFLFWIGGQNLVTQLWLAWHNAVNQELTPWFGFTGLDLAWPLLGEAPWPHQP